MPGIVMEARGLSKYFGDITAVNDLSIAVQQGEILGFLGPNGAGKTTTINILCGINRPDSGSVLINGDVLEITFCEDDCEKAQSALSPFNDRISVEIAGNALLIRCKDVVAVLPDILNSLKAVGIACREVHLRQNTLEDVFIQLTGRRLRE